MLSTQSHFNNPLFTPSIFKALPISDIRFSGPCAEIMSTSFTGNEWDSDVDDSNSSEEFMYVNHNVKSTPPNVPSPELYKQKLEQKHDIKGLVPIIVEEDIGSVWKSHEDKVPVSVTGICLTLSNNYVLTMICSFFIRNCGI